MKNRFHLVGPLLVLSSLGCSHAKLTSRNETINVANGEFLSLPMGLVQTTIGGADVNGYGYKGTIPGPVIKTIQGSTITLELTNHTDLDTTLHPHGVRLDNKFDGIPDVTQAPVRPGESFTYQIKFPDAGIYWYHPHVKDWYTRGLGAYGAFLVAPKNPNDFNPVNREAVLMLSDIDIKNGTIAPEDSDNPTHVLMGKFGNTTTINGETNFKLGVHKGEVVRFYVLNAADARPFNFQIQRAKMKVVGSDIGRSIRDVWADSVLVGPAERYIIEALFDQPGDYSILNRKPDGAASLGLIQVDTKPADADYSAEFAQLKEDRDVKTDIESYRAYFDKPVDKKLVMSMKMDMGGHGGHMMSTHEDHQKITPTVLATEVLPLWARTNNIEWEDTMPGMNAGSTLDNVTWKLIDPVTRKENMDIQWEFEAGTPVKIELFNDPQSMHPMQHPIHFHGQRFLVLSINGQENPVLQWKDTVLVRPGERMQILLDASNPGDWMFHCHIGRHSVQKGHMMTMMGHFRVNAKVL